MQILNYNIGNVTQGNQFLPEFTFANKRCRYFAGIYIPAKYLHLLFAKVNSGKN